jgi:ABC-type sugar transport system substrate-binding protein
MEIVTKVVVGSMQASPHKKALSDIVTKYPDIDALFADLAFVGPTYLDVFLERGMNIPVMNGEDINGWLRLWKKYNVRSIAGSFPVYCGRTGIKAIELILKGEPTPKVWWIPVLVIQEEERDKYFRPNFPDGYFATTEVPEKYLIEEYKLLDKFA